MKPSSFEKIESAEIRDIIDKCIRLLKDERPSVKNLLNHEFFAEDSGLKIELVSKEEAVNSDAEKVILSLSYIIRLR